MNKLIKIFKRFFLFSLNTHKGRIYFSIGWLIKWLISYYIFGKEDWVFYIALLGLIYPIFFVILKIIKKKSKNP